VIKEDRKNCLELASNAGFKDHTCDDVAKEYKAFAAGYDRSPGAQMPMQAPAI
jgi:hypothetical protein